VGSDAVRTYEVTRMGVPVGDAVASVLMDRILGIASLLLMSLVGLMLARDLTGNRTIVAALAAAAAVSAATVLLIFSPGVAAFAGRVMDTLPGGWLKGAGVRVLGSIRKYSAYANQLALVLAGSVAVQMLRIIQAYYIGRG